MKLTTICLVALLALSLVGCKGGSTDDVASTPPSAPPKETGPKAGGGKASMNGKDMVAGPGSANFGSKDK